MALFASDRFKRTAEVFARACFYFYKSQRVAVAAHNVDFAAAASAEIAIEDLVPISFQEAAGEFLAAGATFEVCGFTGRKNTAQPIQQPSHSALLQKQQLPQAERRRRAAVPPVRKT